MIVRAVNSDILWRIEGMKRTYGYFMQLSATVHTVNTSMTALKTVLSLFESVQLFL
jgi:hypothetical protein